MKDILNKIDDMEEQNKLVQTQNLDTLKSKFTIKLTGDANDLSEIVNDINSQCHINSSFDNQALIKTKSTLNSKPLTKSLQIKEEVLSQRVILVVPKNSPPHYLSNPEHQNQIVNVENQKRNFNNSLLIEDSTMISDEQNNKSCTQNIIEDRNEENFLIDNAECINLKQMTNSQSSSKQLNGKKHNLESFFNKHKVQTINENFRLDNHVPKTLKRKLCIIENAHSNISKPDFKNNLQPIRNKNSLQQIIIHNGSTPIKFKYSPTGIRKMISVSHFKLNKLLNKEQTVTLHSDSMNDNTTIDNTLPSPSLGNNTEKTNDPINNKFLNIPIANESSKEIKTYNLLLCKKNLDSSSNSFKINTTTELSSLENKEIANGDQEKLSKNLETDTSLHKHSLNTIILEPTIKSESEIQQKEILPKTVSNKIIQLVFDNKEKSTSQEFNNDECKNNSEIFKKKESFVLSDFNNTCNKKHTKSPQIKVNGLMIRAPDPNLLNNLALKEKIQEFRLSNKLSEKVVPLPNKNTHAPVEQSNNSVTPSEVSESLVSTTTTESRQFNKKIKKCQCDQLRREVDEQWKILTHLKSQINKPQMVNNHECDSLFGEKCQLVNDKHVSSMLVKELEEANRKITESLRKEQVRNNALKITLKHKNIRITQLEKKIKTVSKIFEETEKKAIDLKNILRSSNKVAEPLLA